MGENQKSLADILSWPVVTTSRGHPVSEALAKMRAQGVSALVVVEDERPVGIFTERDAVLVASHHDDTSRLLVSEAMGCPPVTVPRDMDYRSAYQLMSDRRIRHLIVVDDDGLLAGIVSEGDFLDLLGYEHLLQVRDVSGIMTRDVQALSSEATADEAVRLMAERRISCVVVEAEGRPVGILTERDVVRLTRENVDLPDTRLGTVMSTPAETILNDEPVEVAIERMNEFGIRRLVVIDEQRRMVGLVTRHDLVTIIYGRQVEYMRQTISRLREGLARNPDRRFRYLIDFGADPVIVLHASTGRVVECNEQACQLLDYPRAELLALCIDEFSTIRGGIRWADQLAEIKRRGHALLETADRRRDGTAVPVEVSARHVEDEPHDCIIATLRDISVRKLAEEKQRLAASVFQSSLEGIVITDPDANIVDANDACCRITGYARKELIGRNPRIFKSDRQDATFYRRMWAAVKRKGCWSGEIWNRRKDGAIFPEQLSITAVRDDAAAVSHYVAVFTDISALKHHERQLEHIAQHDALTGLPNRVLLANRVRQAVGRARSGDGIVALGYLDLDGFKPINDRYGHNVGDRLLVEVARRLRNALRDADTVARLGGDEFAFLLDNLAQADECRGTLDRILATIAQPIILDEAAVTVSASIGVTRFPLDDNDPDTLLRHADQAMYVAKQAGRNRYQFYDPESDRRSSSRFEARAEIVQALAAGEFELYYQPQVDMRRKRVIGVEALIRWRHPVRGQVLPKDFLPVIENSELDTAVGEWVLGAALAQGAAWRRQGLELQMGVNISAHHLQSANFVKRLDELLIAHPDFPPDCLQLEIVETAALEDIGGVSETMRFCRARGVGFALDDFGTGYSSLTYLKRLPAQVLKIDQSFVRDILGDADDLIIVQGVLALARAFERTVIAEGVESAEHTLMLLHLDCPLVQGYGIARPMPAVELPNWLAQWRPDPRWLP